MQLTFHYHPKEQQQAWRFHSRKRVRFTKNIGMALVAWGVAYLFTRYMGSHPAVYFINAMGILFFLLPFVAQFLIPFVISRSANARAQHLLTLSDTALEIDQSMLSRNNIEKIAETLKLYLVYTSETEFIIVPKRIFPNRETETLFRKHFSAYQFERHY